MVRLNRTLRSVVELLEPLLEMLVVLLQSLHSVA